MSRFNFHSLCDLVGMWAWEGTRGKSSLELAKSLNSEL